MPWKDAPNTIFLGGGDDFSAGAIRLDNSSAAPFPVDKVVVDLQRPGAVFSLWGSFTIPARGSAILTQTALGNFNTSGTAACGTPPGALPVPKITVTAAGADTVYLDTSHVLDTGGFDLSCRGNKSLQWRPIATTGIERPGGGLVLVPESATAASGAPYTVTAHTTDAAGFPLSNAGISFVVLSGPNAKSGGQDMTDGAGDAHFTYAGTSSGTDVVQATLGNITGGSLTSSNQASVTWTSASCGAASQPPPPAASNLLFLGANTGQYSDPVPLAALLTDGSGVALSGRVLNFLYGAQSLQAVTDATGVARTVTSATAPGAIPLTVSFGGDGAHPAAQVSTTVQIGPDDTLIQYTGKTLLGTAVPQQLTAKLLDADDYTPIANRTLVFELGSQKVSATTDANGVATATMTLTAAEPSGPGLLNISFAGDPYYKKAFRSIPVTVYLSTSFVVWGGNTNGLKLGDDINFWGSQWPLQVIQGDYVAQGDFKGLADPVDQVHVCQAAATVQSLTSSCWSSKAGQSWPPPLTLPAYIEVIVSTVIVKKNGLIYGNIAAAVVVTVDADPPYAPDPGKPGWGHIVAVIEDGAHVFPAPVVLKAEQTQPIAVAPGQSFNSNVSIQNISTSGAVNVLLQETFDGLQPPSASASIGSIAAGETKAASFPETVPGS